MYTTADDFVAALVPRNAPEGAAVRFRIVSREPLRDGEVVHEAGSPATVDPASGFTSLEMPLLDLGAGRYELVAETARPRRRRFSPGSGRSSPFRRVAIWWRPVSAARCFPYGPENAGFTSLALAEQWMALERKEQARPALEAAVALAPRLGRARELLGQLEIEAGRPERVVELLEPVHAEVKDRHDLLRVLGEAYFLVARYEDAEALLSQAIRLENPDARSLNLLGLARYQVSDFAGARGSVRAFARARRRAARGSRKRSRASARPNAPNDLPLRQVESVVAGPARPPVRRRRSGLSAR